MEVIDTLKDILADPYAYGRKFKSQGAKKIVGYTCSYGPEELIHAAGALPFRIFGAHETILLADRHLQSYCCSIVRGILEEALSGRLDFLDGVVFPHTCDSFQRLSDIWRLNVADCFHIDFVLPVKLNTDSARSYMIDILEQFKRDLENRLGVTISEEMLRDAIQNFNQIRAAMMRIYEARSRSPGVIKGRDLNAIVQAAMIAERSFMRDALTRIADRLEKAKPDPAGEKARRLILTGSVCSQPDIYDAIESAGGAVVWDDLCTGARYFDGLIDTSLPIFEALAQRYLDRAVCPAKHAGLAQRGSALLQAVERHRVDGVVFLFLKFCDPHAFDYPYLKEMLDKARIPSLLLEIEDQRFSQGQMQTRLETFIEII